MKTFGQENRPPRALAIVGATASGKSALALALAKRLDGEILSVDSMQVYRGMDIGTAKPTAAERAEAPHHLIDICDPKTPFSVADYIPLALSAVRDVFARGRLPVFCGGTGLYLDSLLRGEAPPELASDPALRGELADFLRENGAAALHARLRAVDPESADAIHENNTRRVMRALEIYLCSGKPKSVWDRESRDHPPTVDLCCIRLCYHSRKTLCERIDRRVDAMIEAGLCDEVRRLDDDGVFTANSTAAAAIGYKELLPVLRGKATLAEAANDLKLATRHYAKRQDTWFAARPYAIPLFCDDGEGRPLPQEELLRAALALWRDKTNEL